MIPRSFAQRTLRFASSTTIRRITTLRQPNLKIPQQPQPSILPRTPIRTATTSTPSQETPQPPQNTPAGDAAVEELTELYATAYDEFEIASESTEANATYAEEDRKAAREELENVLEAYKKVGEGGDAVLAEEVRRRVGQRVRELEQGVKAMEERAMEHD